MKNTNRRSAAGKNLIWFDNSDYSIFRDAPEIYSAAIPGAA
jgi:hypothetical protein